MTEDRNLEHRRNVIACIRSGQFREAAWQLNKVFSRGKATAFDEALAARVMVAVGNISQARQHAVRAFAASNSARPPAPASVDADLLNTAATVFHSVREPASAAVVESLLRKRYPSHPRSIGLDADDLRKAGRILDAARACVHALNELRRPDADAGHIDPRQLRVGLGVRAGKAMFLLGRLDEARALLTAAASESPEFAYETLTVDLADDRLSGPEVARRHAEWGAATYPDTFPRPAFRSRAPGEPLRLGYLCNNLRLHSVAFFLASVFAAHDPARVTLFIYDTTPDPDAYTDALKGLVRATWRDLRPLDDDAAAELIRADHIDLLLETSGPLSNHRLGILARRPAPVQAAYLAYPAPTGLPQLDARLTDAFCEPAAGKPPHGEEIVHLPRTFFCYTPTVLQTPVTPLPAPTAGYVTFGILSLLSKIRPPMIALYARVLLAVPASKLLIKSFGLADASVRDELAAAFTEQGVPTDRLLLEPEVPIDRFFPEHARVDIVLDTLPFNGHTTTCHHLYMGIPVVTLTGDANRSRLGLATLTPVGLADLCVAHSPDEFVAKAAALASDLPRLAELRRTLRDRMIASPIMDGPAIARDLEDTCETLWQRLAKRA